jgi:acyl transferase domain-containing protein
MSAKSVTKPTDGIAVVGLGCWYPGASGPRELWENILARRRQFRRIPDCRLPMSDYHDPDPAAPDKTYGRRAAVIDGFRLMTAAERKGLPPRVRHELAETMERYFKSVFPPVTEDTLAGGLSNTIAGRICNAFDFHGGGYTVDGACSSSLLAVCTAADRLNAGDLDLAMAGGVDVSLDTFELVGFAKTGALTPDDMRVYDRRANRVPSGRRLRVRGAQAAGGRARRR